jgi:hypothetical protein
MKELHFLSFLRLRKLVWQTYKLTDLCATNSWSRILKNLIVARLFKIFSAAYEISTFMFVFTGPCPELNACSPSNLIPLRFISILPFHLRRYLPGDFLCSCFPPESEILVAHGNAQLAHYSKTFLKRNLKGPEHFSAEARSAFNQDTLW